MSTLSDLGELPTLLSNSLLSQTPLWQREVRTLSPLDLDAFVALHKGTSQYCKALREVDHVVNAGMAALVDGPLDSADFVFFDPPKQAFTSADLCEWLEDVTLIRRRALLFALDMKMTPREVIDLSWPELKKLRLTMLAKELVKVQPRHIRLPYVFWDTLPNGAAAPLFGLGESALEASQGLGFETMQRLYDRMVMIDSQADLDSFTDDFNTEFNNRLQSCKIRDSEARSHSGRALDCKSSYGGSIPSRASTATHRIAPEVGSVVASGDHP